MGSSCTKASKAHPLNAICPYYTMFPLTFPEKVLRRAKPGDWVVDPFCGRGTTNLAARLAGVHSLGVDSNPVAVALANSKLVDADVESVMRLARKLLRITPTDVPIGGFWKAAYHTKTLRDVCALREGLLSLRSSPSATFLRALALGALHGPTAKGNPSYFSNQAPRTFAPKPRYSVKFWSERNLKAKAVNVESILEVRANRYLSENAPSIQGRATLADSRNLTSFKTLPKPAKWFVTSPPYYGMKTYEQDQWLRLWFLGGPEKVDYAHPSEQISHGSASMFAQDLQTVWRNLAEVADPDARLIIRFGGINDRAADPISILKSSLSESGWRLTTLRDASTADNGKRQLPQFGTVLRAPRPEIDAYCKLT